MTTTALKRSLPDDETLDTEALRVLSRLSESGACLAIARDMEKAVVVRDTDDGSQLRTAVVDSTVAEALALKDWIEASGGGRITRYRITAAGRLACKRLAEIAGIRELGNDDFRRLGSGDMDETTARRRRQRYAAAESPLMILSRRKDKAGKPFLTQSLVASGERLREDFELARMSDHDAPDWRDLMDVARAPQQATGFDAARLRLGQALADLGPDLGDIAIRCCCNLEGLESVETSLGWSARSGKIVLRIALTRLERHYTDQGPDLRMIG